MSARYPIFPQATPELAEQRKRLAPGPAVAFRAFSQSVFAEGALPGRTKQPSVQRERSGPFVNARVAGQDVAGRVEGR